MRDDAPEWSESVACPYCGESLFTQREAGLGNQEYIEDCHVCCRPIRFITRWDPYTQSESLTVLREDD
ncbi:CPXCG motif-containing cysteine-rich protein [Magnetofaba australis]|uniref:CPXCG motif-containing cysteine-rich protein n=1 Tax=Magnetofaba australis IT-1 TaxID=1434232 RepID=A0A1Y2K6Y0_9PROT|nr:CPXCG motif-containing cysteine-rich protein [Magnetofaba australis]OSM05108.1 hypothetical protein MAIT1_03253 [Magnetofaba australis IT-1]